MVYHDNYVASLSYTPKQSLEALQPQLPIEVIAYNFIALFLVIPVFAHVMYYRDFPKNKFTRNRFLEI